jgi:hypothetical protein
VLGLGLGLELRVIPIAMSPTLPVTLTLALTLAQTLALTLILTPTDSGDNLGISLGTDLGTDLGMDFGTDLGTNLGSEFGDINPNGEAPKDINLFGEDHNPNPNPNLNPNIGVEMPEGIIEGHAREREVEGGVERDVGTVEDGVGLELYNEIALGEKSNPKPNHNGPEVEKGKGIVEGKEKELDIVKKREKAEEKDVSRSEIRVKGPGKKSEESDGEEVGEEVGEADRHVLSFRQMTRYITG